MIRNVIEYLRDSVIKYPDKIAFEDDKKSVTFAELERQSKKIASKIIAVCGDIKNKPIAVYMEKSVDCLVAFMGIAYSGNFYSPLDIKSPADRLQRIVDVLDPTAILYLDRPVEFADADTPQISQKEIDDCPIRDGIENRIKKILDIDPLYVLFTSGSTGTPKGVVISHRGVIDYTEWLKDKFDFDENTIFGNQAPFYFDNSILDIYSTLKNGSTLEIIPESKFIMPGQVLSYMNEKKVNTIFWVPSALVGVANSKAIDSVRLEHIQKVLFCGEVMPTRQLNIWRKHYPNALYANLYGPTEITDVCTYYVVEREFEDDEPLPIGRACENMEVLILNENDKIAEDGEKGELCVRGSGVALGYYDNKEKTEAAFIQNPLNSYYEDRIYRTGDLVRLNQLGEIIYLGRKDFQIKHQGHRIELGEIETATASIDGVLQCCAIYDDIKKRIMLHCVTDGDINEKAIYRSLQNKLPRYMLPSSIYIRDNMPLNLNGKIDRLTLIREGM